MKKQFFLPESTLILSLLAFCVPAQAGETPSTGPEGTTRGPTHPLMMALDTDRDGELSAAEIETASAALKKLDRNQDGKLDRMELRLSAGALRGSPLDGRGQSRPGAGADVGSLFAQRIMRFDEDGDGKVTKDELPERMDRILQQADTNHDDAIDQAEAERFARQFRGSNRLQQPAQSKESTPPEKRENDQ